MPGKQGRRVTPDVRRFIVETARNDPTLSNADVVKKTELMFGSSPDLSTVQRFRDDANIQSSRKAASQVASSLKMGSEQKEFLQKLLDKLVLLPPNMLRMNELVREQRVGKVGPLGAMIHVRFDALKLIECWITIKESKILESVVVEMEDVPDFKLLYKNGIGIVGEVLSHNLRIELGSGDPTFSEVNQLLETKDPEQLPAASKEVHELWNRYSAFGNQLSSFKQQVSDALIPFSIAS